MELIKEIRDSDTKNKGEICYRLRKAARAVVFNKENKIALIFAAKYHYHKLPGGGLKPDEDVIKALRREIREEAGCEIDILKEVGMIIEYRDKFNQLQISYCYLTKVKGDTFETSFEEAFEIAHGFQLKWVELSEALRLLEDDKPNKYILKFINERDYTFLLKAKEII